MLVIVVTVITTATVMTVTVAVFPDSHNVGNITAVSVFILALLTCKRFLAHMAQSQRAIRSQSQMSNFQIQRLCHSSTTAQHPGGSLLWKQSCSDMSNTGDRADCGTPMLQISELRKTQT